MADGRRFPGQGGYVELYEHLTGEKFLKGEDADPEARIEKNINAFLKTVR